jgi:hypothetical protein
MPQSWIEIEMIVVMDRDRDVCCKPWIHFVVGDNSGNN